MRWRERWGRDAEGWSWGEVEIGTEADEKGGREVEGERGDGKEQWGGSGLGRRVEGRNEGTRITIQSRYRSDNKTLWISTNAAGVVKQMIFQ